MSLGLLMLPLNLLEKNLSISLYSIDNLGRFASTLVAVEVCDSVKHVLKNMKSF